MQNTGSRQLVAVGPTARESMRRELLALQWAQLQHDEFYHRDIVILPVGVRMKHMTLHMAKYLGYFVEASDGEGSAEQRRWFERSLIDAFVIVLASANTLSLDLGARLEDELAEAQTLEEIGRKLADRFDGTGGAAFINRFAVHVGRLAKACESLDHLESHPFRDALREGIWGLFELILSRSALDGLGLRERYADRMKEIESRNLFDRYRNGL